MIRLPAPLLIMTLTLLLLWSAPLAAQEAPVPEFTPTLRPAPLASQTQNGITIEYYFTSLQQGRVGLVRLTGDTLALARAQFINRQFDFVRLDGDGWYTLVVARIDASARSYPLKIVARSQDGADTIFEALVPVESAGFFRQNFTVAPDRAALIDPAVERNEFARLDSLIRDRQTGPLWQNASFILPINDELTSAFGTYRILNQTVQTRHTGWDLRAPVGTPVAAMGAGRVAFVGALDIRGHYVLINHGMGVFSGYAHFSQVTVSTGQSVEAGQIIGMSGNSGRSSGPHLHWEVAVNGEWIDSLDFMDLWLPQT